LSKPRYRIYSLGQVVSLLGYWFQQVALSWLVYRLTGSVFLLGLTGFFLQIPSLVVPPIAGMIADSLPRVKLVMVRQSTLAVLAATLALIAASGVTDVRYYMLIAFLTGCVNAIEAPARQSLVTHIVEDRELLPSAIAFHSVMFNLGRMLGPTMAGALLLVVPEVWCFVINSVSYLAVVAAFWWIDLPDPRSPPTGARFIEIFQTTASRLAELPVVRYFLPLVASAALFAAPYQSVMPTFAKTILGGDTGTLGMLIGSAGAGALSTAMFLSMQRDGRRQLSLVQMAPFTLGSAVIVFGLSRSLPLSCLALYFSGASIMMITASTNTLLQLSVEPGWRARVIGVFQMSFAGLNPIGALLAGTLGSHLGIQQTFVFNGCMILTVGLLIRWQLSRSPMAREQLNAVVGA
jgi:MFS family permease